MISRLDQIRAQLTSSTPSPTLGSDVAYLLKLVDELAGALRNVKAFYPDHAQVANIIVSDALAKLHEPSDG